MTVVVGRTQIHLGWPTAVSIIITLVTVTWGFSTYFGEFMRSQKEMNKNMAILLKRDSIHDSEIKSNTHRIDTLSIHVNNAESTLPIIIDALKNNRRVKFYNEKKVDGRLLFLPAQYQSLTKN